MIFGWRLTNKPPHVESEEIKALQGLLADEAKYRADAAAKANVVAEQLEEAREQEHKRLLTMQKANNTQAVVHLKSAERYEAQLEFAKGARRTELQAIVDTRVETARHLGFELKGTITETIQWLLTQQ